MYFSDIDIPRVMAEKGISATAAMVLFWINRFIYASRMKGVRDRRGIPYSYASHEAIAQKVGKSVRTVERATAELRRAGMIEVKRTRKYAHTFMQWQAVYDTDGGSGTDKNGGSIEYKSMNYKTIDGESIYHQQLSMDGLIYGVSDTGTETARPTAGSDARKRSMILGEAIVQDEAIVQTAAGSWTKPSTIHGEGGPAEANTARERPAAKGDRTKHAPTPKRPKRTAAEREEFKRHMLKRLCSWIPFDADGMDEQKRLEALADIIADASSASGRQIVVNGAGLTAGQYWEAVKGIEYSGDIAAMLDRIDMRRASSGIKNLRAYTLAAVYNYCQQAEAMRGAGWTAPAGGSGGRQMYSDRGRYAAEIENAWMAEFLPAGA